MQFHIASIQCWFDRHPEIPPRTIEAILLEAKAHSNADGTITTMNWSWFPTRLKQRFWLEWQGDWELMTIGYPADRVAECRWYVRLKHQNFPQARHGDVVVDGRITFVWGGTPFEEGDCCMIEVGNISYYNRSLLNGCSGHTQVVLNSPSVYRSLEVRCNARK